MFFQWGAFIHGYFWGVAPVKSTGVEMRCLEQNRGGSKGFRRVLEDGLLMKYLVIIPIMT